jgi:hypothetical protein
MKERRHFRPADLTDQELVERIKQSKNGERFARLWAGNTTGYGFDHEAALALCNRLAYWTNGDRERMKRLFEQSGLAESLRGASLEKTLDKAVAGQKRLQKGRTRARGVTKDMKESKETNEMEETEEFQERKEPYPLPGSGCPANERVEKAPVDLARARELADDLVGKRKGEPDVYEESFQLARRLKTLSEEDPYQFEEVVKAYCQKTGHDFEEFYDFFTGVWFKVRLAEGEHPLDWAFRRAKEEPVPNLPGKRPPLYVVLAGMAYHLAQLRGGRPFQIPICDHLASLIKRPKMAISRSLQALIGEGILKIVGEGYNPLVGQARAFAWVWPQKESSPTRICG